MNTSTEKKVRHIHLRLSLHSPALSTQRARPPAVPHIGMVVPWSWMSRRGLPLSEWVPKPPRHGAAGGEHALWEVPPRVQPGPVSHDSTWHAVASKKHVLGLGPSFASKGPSTKATLNLPPTRGCLRFTRDSTWLARTNRRHVENCFALCPAGTT